MARRATTVLRMVLALACLCLAVAATVRCAPQAARLVEYEGVFAGAAGAGGPGAAAIVVKDGRTLFRQARGLANLELSVPLQPESVFRLGSVTKQFTAAAIMMLVEEGKLGLQDPIEKHLPGYPAQGRTITVEHLLTHTSGVQSYTDMPGWMTGRIKADMSVTELVDGFKNEPMQFAPGTKYRYNNSAYVLLGAIIEKVSGRTYEAFIRERIFGPLGMTHSYYGNNEPIIPNRVDGYTGGPDGPRHARYLSMTQPYSAGALLSNVDDLALWDAALYSEKLLRRASLEKMWTPYRLADGTSTGYGYGWQLGTLCGRRTIEHGGGIFGFVTYALRLPEYRVFVAVLCNTDRPAAAPGYLARRLAAIAIGRPFFEPDAVPVNPRLLERLAGVYRIDKDTTRTVTVEGGRLFTQRTGGPRQEAKARSATEFFYENRLSLFRFELDRDGRAVAMVFYLEEGGEPERAVRVADEPATPKAP